jgi:hypothetical protein
MNKNIILLFVGLASASNDDTRPFINPDNKETCYERTKRLLDVGLCRSKRGSDLDQCAREQCRCPERWTNCIQMQGCEPNSTDEGCT